MKLNEFGKVLRDLKPGEGVEVQYEIFSELFPPGEPDDGSRERAYNFAKERGAKIERRHFDSVIWFYKDP